MSYLTPMCFLCLKNNIKLQSVLIRDIDGIVVNEKLRYLFPEIIDSTPDAHKLACFECFEKLRISYDFKQSVICNNTIFRNYIDKFQFQHKSYQQLLETRDFTAKKVEDGNEKHDRDSLLIQNENLNLTSTNQEQLNTHDQSCQLTSNANVGIHTKFNCHNEETNFEIENIEIVDPLAEETHIKQEQLDDDYSTNYLDENGLKTNNQSCQLTTNENDAYFTKLSCQSEDANLKTEDIEVVNPIPEEIYIKEEPFDDDDFTSNYSDEESQDSEDNIYECKICQLGFTSSIYLEKHAVRCNKKAQNPQRIVPKKIKVVTMSSNNNGDSFKCHICDSMYTVKHLYDRHLRVKHCIYDKKREFDSKKCQNSATQNAESNSTPTDYNIQPQPEGANMNRNMCSECHKTFPTRNLLERHKRIHSGEKPYECQICQKKFTQINNLNTHKLTHTGEKPYQCDVCNKTFKQKGNLMRHKLSHDNIRPYQCSVCSKKFTQSCSLSRHMCSHTGETPYQCNICKFRCSDRSSLKRHIRSHTGKKPYQCGVCSKWFTQSCTLTTHMRLHTGETPYQCNICQFKCSNRSNLKRHIRSHSAEKLQVI